MSGQSELAGLRQQIARLEAENKSLKNYLAANPDSAWISKLEDHSTTAEEIQNRFFQTLNHSTAAIAILYGSTLLIEFINPHFLKIIGRTGKNLIGLTYPQALPELEGQGFFERLEEVYRTGRPYVASETPAWLDRKGDGSLEEGLFSFTYYPLTNLQGKIEGLFIHALEVTNEVRARQALEHEKQRLQKLFMNAPASIAVLRGPNHVFELTNDLYLQLIGLREHSIIGKSVAEALPEVVDQGFTALLDKVYATNEPYIGQEVEILFDPKGTGEMEEAFVNFVYQPMLAGDGSGVEGIFAHIVDITEQVKTRQEIEKLGRLKDEFLAIASHDLRTPITGIKGYMQLLLRNLLKQQEAYISTRESTIESGPAEAGFGSDAQINYFDKNIKSANTVLTQINRLNSLLNRLLDFSKISEGQLSLKYSKQADLLQLLEEVVMNLSMTSQNHTILLQSPAQAFEGQILADYDEERIEQVLNNLIGNAIKYSPHGTTITVGVEPPTPGVQSGSESESGNNSELTIWVQDQGYGISEADQEHLFDRFYRVQNEHRFAQSGLGLGLYISKGIIEQHGGRLWVESQEGEGSTFFICLPVKN